MTGHDRRILSVTCYGHFLSHFNMLVFPAILLPLSSRLQMSMTETLDLAFSMYLLFGLTALPWGVLADRIGAKPMLALFYGGAGACGLTAAMLINEPHGLKYALAGIGLFSGIYHPAGLGWIASGVSRTSAGMAYNGMFGNLGLATGPLLAGIVNWMWDARAVYLCLGLLNLFGLLLLLMAKNEETHAEHKVKAKDNAASWKRFALLLIVMMLGGIVYRGTTVSLPALFELKATGVYQIVAGLFSGRISPNVVATAITSGLYLLGMLGQYSGGRVGERFDLRWGYLVFHALTLPAAFALGIATNVPLVMLATFHSFFLLGMQPIENTLVARLTPPSLHSSAFGMKFVVTFGVGALAVKLVRYVETGWGLGMVFPALGLVSLVLVSMIILLMRATPPMHS